MSYKKKMPLLLLLSIFMLCVGCQTPYVKSASANASSMPSIELFGDQDVYVPLYGQYSEPGYKAYDADDGDITSKVIMTGYIDTDNEGSYERKYHIVNSKNNATVVSRLFHVVADYVYGGDLDDDSRDEFIDASEPTIELNGDLDIYLGLYEQYTEPGYKAYDANDGDISKYVVITGYVDIERAGTYVLTYHIVNSSNATCKATRSVHVGTNSLGYEEMEGDGWDDGIDYESEYGFDNDHIILTFPTGHEKVFVVYDLNTRMEGIYDIDADEYLIEPNITSGVEFDDQGIACVEVGEYYGFIDRAGNKLTGFIFDRAAPFRNGVSIISLGKKKGAIDHTGHLIVKNVYDSIEYSPDERFLIAQKENKLGLFNCAGEQVIPNEYYGFQFKNGRIYAVLHDFAANISASFCHLYDETGALLVGGDQTPPKDTLVVPPVNGRSILCYLYQRKTNKYGFQYKAINRECCLSFADLDGKPISDAIYNYVTNFNDIGLALAYYTLDDSEHRAWVVVDMDGTELYEIPNEESGDQYGDYSDATHSFAIGHEPSYKTTNERFILVDLTSNTFMRWADVQRIPSTECLFVRDSETDMYGLYDGNELVFPCMYHSYSLDGDVIVMEQGSERIRYTPKQF